MDRATIQELIALNTRFYRENAASFSTTRSAPWEGWRQAAPYLEAALGEARAPFGACDGTQVREHVRADDVCYSRAAMSAARSAATSNDAATVLDLACGNLRFERFLSEVTPGRPLVVHAVDNCRRLAAGKTPVVAGSSKPSLAVIFHDIDILQQLLAHADSSETPCPLPEVPPCDASVSFGFMHHIPTAGLRRRVLQLLAEHTRPGGVVVVSFWQFMHDDRLSRKAVTAAQFACEHPDRFRFDVDAFEPGDHLLGWQDSQSFRYCHHFEDDEIDELVTSLSSIGIRERARYSADGKNHALNRYVILSRE